jgi:hypothetical protein
MSELSDNIKTTFKNIITVYQETSKLLQDATSIIEKSGYQCLHGNTIGTEQSKDINRPQWWITPYVSRYFSTQENPEEMKAIGVFYVDRSYEPIDPIIAIGCFKMKKDEDGKVLTFSYWYLKEAIGFMEQEGKPDVDFEFQGRWNLLSGRVRTIPLDDVKDQETLKKNVIDPFIAMTY